MGRTMSRPSACGGSSAHGAIAREADARGTGGLTPWTVLICGLGAMLAGGASAAQAPAAAAPTPDYVSIIQAIHVDRPPETVWKKVGGYCDLGAMMKISCIYTAGDGGLGTNRLLAGRINEVMVARTSTSYTYAQPLSPDSYHGTVEILSEGSGSKIVYTIFHDASALKDAAARDSDRARRAGMFNAVLKAMKAAAEAP